MKVLFDLNVIFDVIADREPFAKASRDALALGERGEVETWIAAHRLTTLFYLVARRKGTKTAHKAIAAMLTLFKVAPVDETRLAEALADPTPDLEDALQIACARSVGAQYIVTRDPKGFRRSAVPTLSPTEFIATVQATRG